MSLDEVSDGRKSILVITDAYTKYAKAIPTKNQIAVIVSQILMNEWVFNFGTPEKEGIFKQKLHRSYTIYLEYRSRSSPYNPQGN